MWISPDEGYSAWLPTSVLTYLNPDGEEQPYEFYQQALVRLNKGACLDSRPSKHLHTHRAGCSDPSPLRSR